MPLLGRIMFVFTGVCKRETQTKPNREREGDKEIEIDFERFGRAVKWAPA